MITGIDPFYDKDSQKMIDNINTLHIDWQKLQLNEKYKWVKKLIKILLKKDPQERPEVSDVFSDQLFAQHFEKYLEEFELKRGIYFYEVEHKYMEEDRQNK